MGQLLIDLRAEHEELAGIVRGADLRTTTPAKGWDVGDSVAHLHGTNIEATRAAARPEEFRAGLTQLTGDGQDFLQRQIDEGRAMGGEGLMTAWAQAFDGMCAAFAALQPGTKVPWYGPPMSPVSFATARLMEYWAHGQDIADGLGVTRTPTARLRHIAHLGVRTRGFSYVIRGQEPPPVDVRVELQAPDGQTWTWGTGPDRVTGPAVDFCLLVTQRRHRDDLSLTATGEAAQSWLGIAQAFAGTPGPGRAPLGATA
ncbi:MAG: hypothetical protein JWN57_2632 [Frankiales bacterium]|jgi:uncharacterized protein (TIGR03084 family)|nr:hypothetical protein [Frankiales bacterium]